MSKRRRVTPAAGPRRAGAAGAALVLAGAGLVLGLGAGPAQAAEVSFATRCVPPAGVGLDPVNGTTKVEVTAPATAKVGDEITVVWKFTQAASKNPNIIDLPANSVQPTGTLKAAGAQSADIVMTGPRENPAIPKGGDMVLSDMKGTLKLTAAGELTLTPGPYTVNAMGTNTVCTPTETVPKAATVTVAEGDGSPTPDPTDTTTPTSSPTPTPPPTPTDEPSATPSATPSDDGQTDFTGKAVDIPYTCQSPLGEKKATSTIQVNAKKSGGSYGLTVQFKNSPMDSPADIPADSVKPSMEVVLGGDDKGSVQVEGPTNSEAIKSGDPIEIPDMTGTYKPGATGESTLSPGVLTIEALGTTTTCRPDKTEVSLTLTTKEQEGGASGGSSSSGGTSSGGSTSGGLAATGGDDHAALKALGLVAGTAVLLGAAVFTFMPGRRTR